jgi:hypothetical protein
LVEVEGGQYLVEVEGGQYLVEVEVGPYEVDNFYQILTFSFYQTLLPNTD